ncbi:hypothetical protein JW905_05895, partial [bacterium]|nr:hypothetical protein [candidate division CSSED10-310 bacterium]
MDSSMTRIARLTSYIVIACKLLVILVLLLTLTGPHQEAGHQLNQLLYFFIFLYSFIHMFIRLGVRRGLLFLFLGFTV